MRTAISLLLIFAISFSVLSATENEQTGKIKDEELIQGTWEVVKIEFGNGKTPPDIKNFKQVFKEGMWRHIGTKAEREGTYKLDSTSNPKAIDTTQGETTIFGIYELDGDNLKICMSEGSGSVRPKEMKAEGDSISLVTYKRVKESK